MDYVLSKEKIQKISSDYMFGPQKLPWYEEVLRSLSISFLSMMLSSTAKTWNCDSAAIPIFSN